MVNKAQNTHMSVDCLDCHIQQKGCVFGFHKFKNKAGLHYRVALGILTGEIKWINGQYPCGEWQDITIFRDGLIHYFDSTEMGEADNAYTEEEPYKCTVPSDVLGWPLEMDEMIQRVQGWHDSVYTCLNFCLLMEDLYRRDPIQQGYVLHVVAVLMHLSIENGDTLYEIEYKEFLYSKINVEKALR